MRILAALLCALSLPALASEPSRLLTLSGTAMAKTAPDTVDVSFAIETRRSLPASQRRDFTVGTPEALKASAELLAQAQAASQETAKRVRESLKALGLEERQVKTESFQVEPQTWSDDGVLYLRGYLCRHVMSVTLKDPAKADACVDAALKGGATHIHGVTFHTSRIRKLRDEARRMACKAAREKADLLAGELGAKVKRVLTIQEGGASVWCAKSWGQSSYRQQQDYAQNSVQYMEFAPAPAEGEPGELGTEDVGISASVSVTFELE